MKKNTKIPILIVLIISCTGTPSTFEKGEECSIKISGIEFTRSLNDAKSLVSVKNGKLVVKSNPKSDYFNDTDGKSLYGTAPVLLSKIDNTQPFTFVAKVTPTFQDTYDAGTLFIYLNEKWWFKFAFERDERKHRRIVSVRTAGTSDDNNHDVIDGKSAYMKISSNTQNIGFYYSLDKENWQLVRLFRNEYPLETWIGFSAQSPVGDGTITTFEECSLTQTSIEDFRMGI